MQIQIPGAADWRTEPPVDVEPSHGVTWSTEFKLQVAQRWGGGVFVVEKAHQFQVYTFPWFGKKTRVLRYYAAIL